MLENTSGADPQLIYVIKERNILNIPKKTLLLGLKWAVIRKLSFE